MHNNHNYLSMSGWKFGLGVCLTYLSIDYTASTASIFNLFILSLDRWANTAASVNRMVGRCEKASRKLNKRLTDGKLIWYQSFVICFPSRSPVLKCAHKTAECPDKIAGGGHQPSQDVRLSSLIVTRLWRKAGSFPRLDLGIISSSKQSETQNNAQISRY